jgi:hypothetical protein
VIPYIDLQLQYQSIKPEIDAAVLKVLASAQFILGDEVAAIDGLPAQISLRDRPFSLDSGIGQEMRRVFEVCRGCRLCFNLCGSFPTLFNLVCAPLQLSR